MKIHEKLLHISLRRVYLQRFHIQPTRRRFFKFEPNLKFDPKMIKIIRGTLCFFLTILTPNGHFQRLLNLCPRDKSEHALGLEYGMNFCVDCLEFCIFLLEFAFLQRPLNFEYSWEIFKYYVLTPVIAAFSYPTHLSSFL